MLTLKKQVIFKRLDNNQFSYINGNSFYTYNLSDKVDEIISLFCEEERVISKNNVEDNINLIAHDERGCVYYSNFEPIVLFEVETSYDKEGNFIISFWNSENYNEGIEKINALKNRTLNEEVEEINLALLRNFNEDISNTFGISDVLYLNPAFFDRLKLYLNFDYSCNKNEVSINRQCKLFKMKKKQKEVKRFPYGTEKKLLLVELVPLQKEDATHKMNQFEFDEFFKARAKKEQEAKKDKENKKIENFYLLLKEANISFEDFDTIMQSYEELPFHLKQTIRNKQKN